MNISDVVVEEGKGKSYLKFFEGEDLSRASWLRD